MITLKWSKDDEKKYKYVDSEFVKKLCDFAEKHGYDITEMIIPEQIMYMDLDNLANIFRKMGFTIEVTEVSSAGIIDGYDPENPPKKGWIKKFLYRWQIAEWDHVGNMIALHYDYKDPENPESIGSEVFYDGYYEALHSAMEWLFNNR